MTMMKVSLMICLEEMMSKKKLALILALGLSLTACAEDKYISVRHGENEAVEVTDSDLEENPTENEASSEETTEEAQQSEEVSDEPVEVTDDMLEEESDGVIFTVTGVVNVRMAPSENSEIIGQANPGEDIVKLGDSDNWSRVSFNGQTGYIRSDLLEAR